MKRKTIGLLATSHLLAIAIGVLLAKRPAPAQDSADSRDALSRPTASRNADAELAAHRSKAPRSVSTWRGSEYAKAWRAVRTARLTTSERQSLQRDLLAKWAEVDLVSAIEAALDEEWDSDGSSYYNPFGPLLSVFNDAFAKNPQDSWDLLASKRFGLATGMLRKVWIESVGMRAPEKLVAKLGELSWRDQSMALAVASNGVWESNVADETREKVFEILRSLPDGLVTDEQLASFVRQSNSGADLQQLKSEVLELHDQDAKMARVKALALGSRLALNPDADLREAIEELPQDLRATAAWGAFDNWQSNSTSLEAADLLVQYGAWDKLESREVVWRMQALCRNGESSQVAEWATSMPYREETSELFYRCVETFLRQNMEDSRGWIASIATPEWRDRAYAEYSQQALNAHNDPAASRWALNQIRNSNFKATAESWRADWERRTAQSIK